MYDYSKGVSDKLLNDRYIYNFKKIFKINKTNFNVLEKQKFFINHHLPGLLKRIDLNQGKTFFLNK